MNKNLPTSKILQKILPKIWGYRFILFGIAFIVSSNTITNFFQICWLEQLLSSLGNSFFCLGIVSCLIDLKDWKNYFTERVKDIVLNYAYIKLLDEETLKQLQGNVYKSLFKNANFDDKSSFYNYYLWAIEPLINDPYRDDVKQELMISLINEQTIKVVDKVSFICRDNGTNHFPEIQFAYTSKEFQEIEKGTHKVFIKYPLNHEEAGKIEEIKEDGCKEIFDKETDEHFYKFNLKQIMQDGLIIIKESTHEMNISEFQTWEMAHITRKFEFIANFPCNYELQIKPFVLRPELGKSTKSSGYLRYEYESWMLPRNGIAWKLNKISDDSRAQKACQFACNSEQKN